MNTMNREQRKPGEIDRSPNRLSRFFMHVLLPFLALTCGIVITIYLLNTGPQARPAQRTASAILVEVEKLSSGPQNTVVNGMGEIIPAREVEIKPQVSGEIMAVSQEFQPGGYFAAGEKILSIDRTDYELVLQQLASDVAKAESDLAMEMGNQRIAEREYALLDEQVSDLEKNLILRKPQLDKLQAVRDDALARRNQARLNLERTDIKAPFNGVVVEKAVDTGAKVNESTTLAKIVGTDSFWLKLTLPIEQLQWLTIPGNSGENGATVTIFPQGSNASDVSRKGEVVRLIASLEEQGRMSQLLIRVDDPLCRREENRGKPKLLLGSYVRAEIEGVTIDSAFRIDRSNLHDGNTIWLMDDDGTLDIRLVDVSYRDRDEVIVQSGIRNGENLIVSTLPSPVAGTPLRLHDDPAATDGRKTRPNDGQRGQGRLKHAD